MVALLLMATSFLLELSPDRRDAIGWLGGLAVPASFTLSTGAAFLFAGDRHLDGHSIAGMAMLVVAVVWAGFAALPYAIRRPHGNLTDLLASFALAAAATATGLLLGGPAQVCAWAAEAALLVLAAERIAGRSRTRQIRLTLASGVYLVLATIAALTVVWPTPEHLAHIGAGSWDGSIALAAIALAGIAYCFGTRWVPRPERVALWLLPALGGRVPAGVGAGSRVGGGRLRRDRGGAVRLPPLEADDLLAARRHGAGDRRGLVDLRRLGRARRHVAGRGSGRG